MNPTPTTFILSSLIKMRNVTLRPLVMIINNIHKYLHWNNISHNVFTTVIIYYTNTMQVESKFISFWYSFRITKNVLLEEDLGLLTQRRLAKIPSCFLAFIIVQRLMVFPISRHQKQGPQYFPSTYYVPPPHQLCSKIDNKMHILSEIEHD